MPDAIVLIGGGGHCRSCIHVMETSGYTISGIIDDSITDMFEYPVLGGDEKIDELITDHSFLVTVGQVKNPSARMRIHASVAGKGGKFATVISSFALVSRYAAIGDGTIIMHQVIVNAGSIVGSNCI